jgi:hypothetical protein
MGCCLRNVVRPWTSSAFFSFSRVSICRNLESSRLSRVIKVEPNIKALKNISEATSFRGRPTHTEKISGQNFLRKEKGESKPEE